MPRDSASAGGLNHDDFNARFGSNSAGSSVLGPHGMGKENSNGLLLLTLCSEEELTITNMLFKQLEANKATRMHPPLQRRDISDILVKQAMRGADCWTVHVMLRCKASFRIASKHRKQPNSVKKKLDVNKLNSAPVQQDPSDALSANLQQLPQDDDDPDAEWTAFGDTVYSTAKSVLGHPQRKRQHWFDNNNQDILDLLARKRAAHEAWMSDKTLVIKAQEVQGAKK